jgi:hypothetical protein
MARTATLRSPLAPAEVAARLKAQTDSAWVLFHSRPLVGVVGPRSARVRRVIFLRNAFQKSLSAAFEGDAGGTVIRCRFSIFPHVLTYLAVFILGALGMVYPALGGAQGIEAPGGLDYLMMAGGFLLFGVVLAMFASWLARDDERFLIDFVARTTQAEVVDRGPA